MKEGVQTVDLFHRGRFVLVQPKSGGHRAGMDAMILAGAVPAHFTGRLVDLGAGSGGAALAVLSRLAHFQQKICDIQEREQVTEPSEAKTALNGVHATLVEYSPLMLDFAKKTKEHPLNAHLRPYISIVAADVTWCGQGRLDAGLADHNFDFALMNPPFNEACDRPPPDAEKAQAHVMAENMWQNWLRTAAAIVRPGGGLALIARPLSLHDILVAARGRFGGLIITPIFPRPGRDAIRIIVSGQRGSRKPLAIGQPLILHAEQGHAFTPRTYAINNGFLSLWEQSYD